MLLYLFLLLSLCIKISFSSSFILIEPYEHHINLTLNQIDNHIVAQRYDEASDLGTLLILALISGPYFHTLQYQHLEAIARVLDTTPVNLYARTNSGDTLLHNAVRRSNLHLVKLLLFTNATQVNAQSDDGLLTALHLSVEYGHYDILFHLVNYDSIDGTVQDRHGRTPLHSAVLRSSMKIVQLLLDAFPEAMYISDYHGDTPQDLAKAPPATTVMLSLLSSRVESISKTVRMPKIRFRPQSDRLQGNGKWSHHENSTKTQLRCDIDVIDGSKEGATELFVEQYFSRSKPVILQNMVKNWPGRDLFHRSKLLLNRRISKQLFQTSTVPYDQLKGSFKKRTISNFVNTCMRGSLKQRLRRKCLESEVLFDRVINGTNTAKWLNVGTNGVPEIAQICMSSYPKPSSVRRPLLIISAKNGSFPFHNHQHSVNALFYGKKEWMLVPPNFAPIAIAKSISKNSWEATTMELETMGIVARCTQVAGDLLYVPRMWAHATRTQEESVAVAIEFCSAIGSQQFAHREKIAPELYGADHSIENECLLS
jgi:ankyrin repeat protein